MILNSLLYSLNHIELNETYFLQKDNPLILTDIELKDNNRDGNYVFVDKEKMEELIREFPFRKAKV